MKTKKPVAKRRAENEGSRAATTKTKPLKGMAVHDALVTAAERLLTKYTPQKITTSMVLKEARVARGSLYHHFRDLSHLLETALIMAFSRYVDANIQMLQDVVLGAQTRADLVSGLKQITAISQGESRKDSRAARVRLISYSEKNPRLQQALEEVQDRLTTELEKIFLEAKHRGWIRADIPPRAAAVFIQSYTLGKIVDDLVPQPIPESDWNSLIGLFMERTLLQPD